MSETYCCVWNAYIVTAIWTIFDETVNSFIFRRKGCRASLVFMFLVKYICFIIIYLTILFNINFNRNNVYVFFSLFLKRRHLVCIDCYCIVTHLNKFYKQNY